MADSSPAWPSPGSVVSFRDEVVTGFRKAAPLAVAVWGFGVSFGIVARTADMGWLAPVLMSATTFAGSAQFASASIVSTGGGAAAAIVAAVLLNMRYIPIGISIAPAISGSWPRRLLTAQLVVDESWAVAHVGEGRYSRGRLVGAGALVYVAWVSGTFLGVLGAQILGDPEQLGLDVIAPVLFLALLTKQIASRRTAVAALAGAAIALALTPLAPPGIPIVAAAAACLVGWEKKS